MTDRIALHFGDHARRAMFGLATRPEARRLRMAVHAFLCHADILAWNRAAAECYGSVRAGLTGQGNAVSPLDRPIAAHAPRRRRQMRASAHRQSCRMEQKLRACSPRLIDAIIVEQALCVGAVLAANDRAFSRIPGLIVEDRCAEPGTA